VNTRLAVGVETSCKAPPRLELLKIRLCRLLGARTILLPDHLQTSTPGSGDGAFLDPFQMLAVVAARHRGARVGTGVTDCLRRHPAVLARAFLTLDHLSGGRAIAGLGAGAHENLEPFGLGTGDRVGALAEGLEIMQLLWNSGGRPLDFSGQFWNLRQAVLATPLHGGRPPAVWLGGHSRRLLALAGARADGWYPTVKLGAAEYARGLAAIRAAAGARDRARAFEPALQAFDVLGEERARVLAQMLAHPGSAPFLLCLPSRVWRRHGSAHPLGDRRGFADYRPEEASAEALHEAAARATPALLADGVFAGAAAQIAAEVQALVDSGLRHIVLANMGPGWRGWRGDDLVRLALLIHRLRRIPLPSPP
jgi:phthiodiolone/phenolphthiodiolone dimycocerosates ketoreductase